VKNSILATAAFQQAVKINPRHAPSWYNLGFIYYSERQYDKARGVLQNLDKLDPALAAKLRSEFKEKLKRGGLGADHIRLYAQCPLGGTESNQLADVFACSWPTGCAML
jgi:tetratricopeptide (TPR) repeat protein